MKVKNKKYVITLPFLHGMGEAITWLEKNCINYTWRNVGNYNSEYSEKKIEYVFADEGDAIQFALVFAA